MLRTMTPLFTVKPLFTEIVLYFTTAISTYGTHGRRQNSLTSADYNNYQYYLLPNNFIITNIICIQLFVKTS